MEREERKRHVCPCRCCREDPLGATARWHQALNEAVYQANEKQKRLVAGLEALRAGWGGITEISAITGLARKTISRGIRELRPGATTQGRVRKPGGGRPAAEKKRSEAPPVAEGADEG